MERTKKKKTDPNIIWWRKIGGGTFRLANGKIIKPDQKFQAREDQIPLAHRDVVIPLDELPSEKEKKKPLKVKQHDYGVQHRGGGWYDVVDSNGKVLNDDAMKKDEAENYIDSLKGN